MAGGIITKLREKVGIVIIVIGFSMVAFILTDLFQSGSFLFYSDVIGEARGEELKYNDFRIMVEKQIAIQEQQLQRPLTEEERDQVIETVWNQWINDVIFKHEANDAGIDVSPEELVDMFLGENPHPEVVRLFTGGGKVQYNKEQVRQILQQANQNPEVQFQLKLLEEYLVKQRTQEKFFTTIRAGVYVPDPLAEKLYYDQSTIRDIEFLAINYASVPDTIVEVSESDFEDFYNENKERFRQRELAVGINYVRFDKIPSKEDSTNILNKLLEYKKEWETQAEEENFSDSAFATLKSEYTPAYIKTVEEELDPQLKLLIDSLKPGEITEPFIDGNYYKIVKYVGKTTKGGKPLHLRHIFIAPRGQTPEDSMQAVRLADSVASITTKDNFAEMVNMFSMDNESAGKSGDLGWYYPGTFGGEFDSVITTLKKGEVFGPIKSRYGYHIVEVVDEKDSWTEIAIIGLEIVPSSKTLQAKRRAAMQLLADLHQNTDKDLKTLAADKGYVLRTADNITPSNRIVPGFSKPKELTRWALLSEENDIPDEIIDEEEAYIVAQVFKRIEPGYTPLRFVKDQIKTEVYNKKKAEYIVGKLNSISGQSLENYRDAYVNKKYAGSVYISKSTGLSFSSATVKGVGNDPILLGSIFALEPNKLSKPIAAKTGVYVVKVTKINKPQKPTQESLNSIKMSTAAVKNQIIQGKAYNGAKEYANIVDNRYRFGY